ncbi:MAG: isoprenylcysteine carboxylmethyltransferase family protein [Bacteroidota bacterium]|nr:isoprenylcysteine carboxylmethyltransferase family protein [Bacteroidota bacterium]
MELRKILFKYRSYTPIPFILLMIIFARPTIISIIGGFIILAIGEFVRLWGVSIAGSETRTTNSVGSSRLVTSGPFAYLRNPLYFGNICMYLGVGIMSWAGFPQLPIITFAYFIFQYTLIVSLEEEHLIKTYGTEYQRYKKSVPKFFPSLKKYNSGDTYQPTIDWKGGIKSENRTFQAIGIIVTIIIILWLMRVFFDWQIKTVFYSSIGAF